MKVLIIEDDIAMVVQIKMSLGEHNFQIENETHFDGAFSRIQKEHFDLVILDYILGSDKTAGSRLAHLLKEKNLPFIFITANHSENIFKEMLDLSPLAYFKKPLDNVALTFQITSFYKKIFKNKEEFFFTQNGGFFIKQKSKLVKLDIEDILMVEVSGNYITVLDTSNNKFLLRSSMKKFLSGFNSLQIIRVHRNYMVNVNLIKSVDLQKKVIHIRDMEIPFGRLYKKNVIDNLKGLNLL